MKIHLLDTAEKLDAFHGLVCRCGQVLENAQAVYFADLNFFRPEQFNSLRDCARYWLMPPVGTQRRQYVYGLCEKRELVDPERWAEVEEAV